MSVSKRLCYDERQLHRYESVSVKVLPVKITECLKDCGLAYDKQILTDLVDVNCDIYELSQKRFIGKVYLR